MVVEGTETVVDFLFCETILECNWKPQDNSTGYRQAHAQGGMLELCSVTPNKIVTKHTVLALISSYWVYLN